MIEQIKIEFTNSIKVLDNIDNIKEITNKVLGEALKKEAIPYNFFLLVVFVTPEEIKRKNKEFRGVNETTDVLSFPMFTKEEVIDIIKYSELKEDIENDIPINIKIFLEDSWTLGEIYINLEKIEEQAIEYNHSVIRELSYILVHGFYHLLGEDHLNEEEKNIMRNKEEKILKELGITREGNIYE